MENPTTDLPGKLGNPAKRALDQAGLKTLQDVSQWKKSEILKLHGVGPNAIQQLEQAFEKNGLYFTG